MGLLYSYGAQVLSDDTTRSLLDQPASLRAHQYWADLYLKHRVSPTPQDLREANVTGDAFAAGRIGMYLTASFQVGRYRESIKDFEWDIAPSPKGPLGRTVQIAGNPSHGLAATGKQKDRAWEFLRWWIGKQTAQQVVLPGNIPTRLAAARQWLEDEKKAGRPKNMPLVLEDAQKHGRRIQTAPRFDDWDKVWADARNAINAGTVPVEQGLKEATQKIDQILKG